jgi:phosphoglycerate-specific signal transduction histidine kinase
MEARIEHDKEAMKLLTDNMTMATAVLSRLNMHLESAREFYEEGKESDVEVDLNNAKDYTERLLKFINRLIEDLHGIDE